MTWQRRYGCMQRDDGQIAGLGASGGSSPAAPPNEATRVGQSESSRTTRGAEVSLRSLIDQAPFPMSLRDLNGRFQVINKLGANLIGHALEDLLGRTAAELFDAQTAAALDTQEHAVHRDGSPTVFELRGQLPDGSARDYLVTKYPVRDADGQLLGVGGISIDITARKDVENQLREAEDRFRGAFDSAAIGMALVDPNGRWLQVNPALCELVGYAEDELLEGTFQGITHPDDLEVDLEFVRQMLDGDVQTYQMDKRYFHKLGHIVWIHLSVSLVRDADGAPAYFVSQIQDISEQKHAEELAEQLRHSQKLDALGRLAGGVAHDFNNMLTAIKGYSQLLLDGLPETDPLRSPAEQISRAAEQASALPRQLLAFSRNQRSQPEIVDVNEVVSASSDMFAPSALLESVAESIGRSEQARRRPRLDIGTIATCLVADDHPAVLDSVARYLDQNGFEVVACATRGDDALAMIAQEQPAIALLDVRMSSLTGIEVARRASLVAPETRIALFTGSGDRAMLERALDAGARAFILKEAPMSELLRALTIVATGGTYVDPELAGALASGQTAGALSPLTKREQQVLGLVADGMTNEKAADALGISPETVQSHIHNAMSKLDADTRTQAVANAFRRSLLA